MGLTLSSMHSKTWAQFCWWNWKASFTPKIDCMSVRLPSAPVVWWNWPPGVNYTNILQARFLYRSFFCSFAVVTAWVWFSLWILKRNQQKKLLVICWWNWLQVWISPTFYEQLLWMQLFCTAFLHFQLVFVIFWWKKISNKKVFVKCW